MAVCVEMSLEGRKDTVRKCGSLQSDPRLPLVVGCAPSAAERRAAASCHTATTTDSAISVQEFYNTL